MTATRSVAKNTVLLSVGLLGGRLLGLFVAKKMTPILGPEGLGIQGYATDIAIIMLTVMNFGLGVLLTREVARQRELSWPLLWSTLRLRWLLGAVAFLLLVVYLQATGKDQLTTLAVVVTALGLFFETSAMACDSVLQAHEKVQYQTVGQLVSAVVYFVLAWTWLDAGWGLMGVIWANAISRAVRLAVMAPLMFWKTGPWRRARTGETPIGMRTMFGLGFSLCLATTLGIMSFKIDTIMLTEMVGKAATGIYVLGHRVMDYMLIVPNLFATAMFPALARYTRESAADARRLGERSLRYMLVVILPATWFVVLAARPMIEWFARGNQDADPAQFAASIAVLQIVVWGVPFQAANHVLNRTLIAAGRERVFVWIGLAAVVANVGLNLLLIPRWGYYGAAAATVYCLAQSLVLHVWNVQRTEYRIAVMRALPLPLFALAASWFAAAV
ncbi:oligosaccharide flippase family protein, partial [bacterium]|nr:oligosaccharide flippase family protein [bacterium]